MVYSYPQCSYYALRGKEAKIENVNQFSKKIGQERKQRARVIAGLEAKSLLDKTQDIIVYS